ncbi:MAG: TIGR02266 family protein [Proteobacteria bacterium]|nr:MAG: TIGR02266 family protein [Pseudomonadota bacterium]
MLSAFERGEVMATKNVKSKKTSDIKAASNPKPEEEKSSSLTGEENRTNQRVPVQLLVDYRSDGNYLFDFCRDLGTGGVFIETTKPLSHGSMVELTFTLPDSKETLEAKGRVIWVQGAVPDKNLKPGMGVQFEEFTPEQRTLLQEFVDRYQKPGSATTKASNKSA